MHDWLAAEGFSTDDINATVANQTTPLMRASFKGELDIARKILAAGGKVELLNADGNNALWLACVEKHLAMIDLLLDAGIDIDNCNDNGATALMYVAVLGTHRCRRASFGARRRHQAGDARRLFGAGHGRQYRLPQSFAFGA